jgi:hypothetical protein
MVGKSLKTNSKNLILPLLNVQGKKKNSVVQNDTVWGFSSFFLSEKCMKQRCFDQNMPFQLKISHPTSRRP